VAHAGADPRVLLDRYELREQVGIGGMGEVWLGWDRRLQRDVAVKLLLAQLSNEPSFRQRFEVEARAAAALDHPNVVNVYDVGDDVGSSFIVMERLPGPSLDRRLAEGPMSEHEVRRIAADLLSGLAAAHAAHVVHRDIKPGNLIRSAGGRWKVGDFGVAKDLASTAHLTLAGVAVGTPAYLAPEQLDGRPATPATDLWAAAVVIREAITGRRPFEGNDPIEVAYAVQHTPLLPLLALRPDVDPALAAALDRALSFDPARRFASAAEMLAAIEGRAPVLAPPPAVPAAPAPVGGVPSPVAAGAPLAPALGPGARPVVAASGPVPLGPAAPVTAAPDTQPAGRSPLITAVWVVAIVGGAVLLLMLVGLAVGAVMVGENTDGDDPPGPDPATTAVSPTTTSPSSSTTAPPQGEAPEDPSGPTTSSSADREGVEPGDELPNSGTTNGQAEPPPSDGSGPGEPDSEGTADG